MANASCEHNQGGEEMSEWKRGPVEVTGEYWVAPDKEMKEGTPWDPWLQTAHKGDGGKEYWYLLRKAAPPRPKPKIEPVAGKVYWVTHDCEPLICIGWCQKEATGLWINAHSLRGSRMYDKAGTFEILAEVPTPAEYLKGAEK